MNDNPLAALFRRYLRYKAESKCSPSPTTSNICEQNKFCKKCIIFVNTDDTIRIIV